jgi:hypothetical protein
MAAELAEIVMNTQGLEHLLLQSLEHEHGAVAVYQAALRCAVDEALREEWEQYLAETRSHIDVLAELCDACRVDVEKDTVGRTAVRAIGAALVASIERALADGDADAAQLVACECVMLVESKDHLNWGLLDAKVRSNFRGPYAALKLACEQMEGEEDEHLFHARSWIRDLWRRRLNARSSTTERSDADAATPYRNRARS